ncbi:hypothetical protein DENSPDRAFT_925855, partial [Dentipellis sp. KUC8613]
ISWTVAVYTTGLWALSVSLFALLASPPSGQPTVGSPCRVSSVSCFLRSELLIFV